MEIEGSGVTVGLDAAVVANHHVIVRRPSPGSPGEVVANFVAAPTLAGMDTLAKRLAPYAPVMAVAEPTSMTWLPLSIALGRAGCSLALVGNRHSARLRSALAGKNKSDPIDADMLSRAGEFFSLEPARIPSPDELALKRVCQRRGKLIVDANRSLRRIISLARWAFPDVWNAFAGSRPTALAVLTRWPELAQLARARVSSVSDVVAAHTRGVGNVDDRAAHIRAAARAWAEFWDGHVDLDALAWETSELLDDYAAAQARLERATDAARRRWEQLWGDDPLLLSVPGMGPITAPTVRAFLADAQQFSDAKQAQSFVGLNPSNWSSGQMEAPSRAITKEGPGVLRLAFYQAGNVARTVDPQLAEFYRRLMVERGHCHTQASCAVARKLVGRTWATLTAGRCYELRDLDGQPITRRQAKQRAATLAVPDDVRRRARARSAATHRARLTR
ncbi:MAG: IS110 family transposase [Acidimicrobiia bacterium]|nr:IS110 family transposase [Acidimicrobiia bacterium]